MLSLFLELGINPGIVSSSPVLNFFFPIIGDSPVYYMSTYLLCCFVSLVMLLLFATSKKISLLLQGDKVSNNLEVM